jgi:hypothetical protein
MPEHTILHGNELGSFVGKKLKRFEILETDNIEESNQLFDHEEITSLRLIFEDNTGKESSIQFGVGVGGFDIYLMRFLELEFQ